MESAIRRWEWLCLAIVAAAFVLLRARLYTTPGVLLGWNSDAALFGLMARAIRGGYDVPVFFWGQFYLGTLTSLLTAAIAEEIGPLTLRIAAALEVGAAALFFWLGLRRAFGRAAAMLATCWLAAGPAFLFHFTIAPIGAEQLLLMAAVLFWYATRARFDRGGEWFTFGVLCGFGMWLHQGVMFLIGGIGVAMLIGRLLTLKRFAIAAIGLVVGYLPAAVSLLRDDVVLYRRTIPSWTLPRVFGNFIVTLREDVWLLLADASAVGIAVGAVMLAFAFAGLRRGAWTRERIIIVATIAFSVAFYTLTTYPYPGAVRYIVPLVPLVYGAAAAGMLRAGRTAAVIAAIAIAAGLYLPRLADVNAVAAARSERYTNWPGDFDPRPTLVALRDGGYRVCYGEVWVAHKLEFLSAPTVRFVPVRLVHRTLPLSLGLIRQPGQKCYVENDGRVRPLSAAEDAQWAATVVARARKAGL